MRIAHYLHVDKRLKSFRMGADMSQKEMAAKLELSVPTYSNYENGYSEPPMEVIQKFYPYIVFVTVNFFSFQFFVQFVPTRYKRCNLWTFYVNRCH